MRERTERKERGEGAAHACLKGARRRAMEPIGSIQEEARGIVKGMEYSQRSHLSMKMNDFLSACFVGRSCGWQ